MIVMWKVASADEIALRLVNGRDACSGRVEMYYNNTWGAVCDDDWDMLDANVACRQLGCGPAQSAPAKAHFGNASGSFWLDDVQCKGTESTLVQCRAKSLGEHNCNPGEEASVICSDEIALRLRNGRDACSGRVEMYYNNTWGAVCDDDWDMLDAKVACRQLGCGAAQSAPAKAHFGTASGSFWLDDVQCEGTESTLWQCRAKSLGEHNCNPGEEASVICSGQLEVRLVNGERPCSGRVEIYYNRGWGTVCDDDWDLFDAEVVCAQLHCGFAESAPGKAQFGKGNSSIWLDSVQCNGSESNLWQCESKALGLHNCNHQEDASVVCSDRPLKPILSLETESSIFLKGDTVRMTCRALSLYAGSTFYLTKVGEVYPIASRTAPEGTYSITFTIKDADVSKDGDYTCHYQTGKSGRLANSTSSDSVYANVRDEIAMRLLNGTDSCSGRVKVYFNNTWGAVCDDDWDMLDATVVCRQLGCGPAESDRGNAHFGTASGHFWLDDVHCKGTESTLWTCPANLVGQHNCGPGEEASVICSGRPLKPILSLGRKSGPFLKGDTVTMMCWASRLYAGGTFYLNKVGESKPILSRTAPKGTHNITFTIDDVNVSWSGDYTCHSQTRNLGRLINSTSSEPVHVHVREHYFMEALIRLCLAAVFLVLIIFLLAWGLTEKYRRKNKTSSSTENCKRFNDAGNSRRYNSSAADSLYQESSF
ncbi:deleted in malignant brain tumors 1 protein-like isoform X2 [Heptranchias perlo]|uniref:deleted in malignant brain tumors 1 protein-like isoform X2 n=1 Tax=Heptranchias perlo TaxID=212740 RepID=UPI00355A0C87